MTEIDELQQAMDELASVQLIDNTWQEAEVVRREITGIIQALHRDLCAEASSVCQQWDIKCQELERQLMEIAGVLTGTGVVNDFDDPVKLAHGIAEYCAGCHPADIRAWRGDGSEEEGDDEQKK